jgi:hypothetical protein
LVIELPVLLLLLILEIISKSSRLSDLRLSRGNRAALFFLVILELCNKTITNLSTLVPSLIILNLSIDHWHVFKIGNIIVLNHKHSATDLDDIVDFQWVEGADFSFSTQTEPGPVS